MTTIVEYVNFIDHLFKELVGIIKNHTIETNRRIKAIEIVLEFGLSHDRNCHELMNFCRVELVKIMESDHEKSMSRLTAIEVLWDSFKYGKKQIKNGKYFSRKAVMLQCLEQVQEILENNNTEISTYISSVDFLVKVKGSGFKAGFEVSFDRFYPKLIKIARSVEYTMDEKIEAIACFLKIVDMGNKNVKFKNNFFNKVQLDILGKEPIKLLDDLFDENSLSFMQQFLIINLILLYSYLDPDKFEKYYYRLFGLFEEKLDSEIWLKVCDLIFNINRVVKGCITKDEAKQCMEKIFEMATDQNESYIVRLKAIQFADRFQKEAVHGVEFTEIASKIYPALKQIIESEKFWSKDYLEALMFGFRIVFEGFFYFFKTDCMNDLRVAERVH